jgi:hypothetical protein
VIANAQTLADELVKHGYKLQTNGTDNHLVLWDLRPLKLTGSKLEKLCDFLGITINSKAIRSYGTLMKYLTFLGSCRKRGFRRRFGTDTRWDPFRHVGSHFP